MRESAMRLAKDAHALQDLFANKEAAMLTHELEAVLQQRDNAMQEAEQSAEALAEIKRQEMAAHAKSMRAMGAKAPTDMEKEVDRIMAWSVSASTTSASTNLNPSASPADKS